MTSIGDVGLDTPLTLLPIWQSLISRQLLSESVSACLIMLLGSAQLVLGSLR